MFNTKSAYKAAVLSSPQLFQFTISVVYDTSSGLPNAVIPADDIFEATFDESAFGTGSFCVGGVPATLFTVRIHNSDGKYSKNALSKAQLIPKFVLYDASGNAVNGYDNEGKPIPISVGQFYTQNIVTSDTDLKLSCVDAMQYLEKTYTVKGLQLSLMQICNNIALSVNSIFATSSAEVALLSKTIDDSAFKGYTNRQVISAIAAACGSFAIFDYSGNLALKWFSVPASYVPATMALRNEVSANPIELNGNTFSEDGNPVRITGVSVVHDDVQIGISAGATDASLLTISDNPVSNVYPSDVATFVWNRLRGTIYLPIKYSRLGGDPSVQAGDILTAVDNTEVYDASKFDSYTKYALYITQRNWSYTGAFTETYEAENISDDGLDKNRGMTTSKALAEVKKELQSTASDLDNEISARQADRLALNTAMIKSSPGMYWSYEKLSTGAVIWTAHNRQSISNSTVIYTITDTGFAWTTSWNNGSPAWQYGTDVQGNAVLNTISADAIKVGTLQSISGKSYINLDTGAFQFSNTSGRVLLALDTSGKLLISGVLKSVDPSRSGISAGIGIGADESRDEFMVENQDAPYADEKSLFTVSSREDLIGDEIVMDAVTYTAPFLFSNSSRAKGIELSRTTASLFDSGNGVVGVKNSQMVLGVNMGSVEIAKAGNSTIWINYYAPSVGNLPSIYKFGNGTEGGLGVIIADEARIQSRLIAGKTDGTYYVSGSTDCVLSVFGIGCAQQWIVESDRSAKSNIIEQATSVLDKVQALKFYSYDFVNPVTTQQYGAPTSGGGEQSSDTAASGLTTAHIDLGLMADEAPSEIQSNDGKAIDLYSYISLCAKAIQELSAKVTSLEARISELEKSSQKEG